MPTSAIQREASEETWTFWPKHWPRLLLMVRSEMAHVRLAAGISQRLRPARFLCSSLASRPPPTKLRSSSHPPSSLNVAAAPGQKLEAQHQEAVTLWSSVRPTLHFSVGLPTAPTQPQHPTRPPGGQIPHRSHIVEVHSIASPATLSTHSHLPGAQLSISPPQQGCHSCFIRNRPHCLHVPETHSFLKTQAGFSVATFPWDTSFSL